MLKSNKKSFIGNLYNFVFICYIMDFFSFSLMLILLCPIQKKNQGRKNIELDRHLSVSDRKFLGRNWLRD